MKKFIKTAAANSSEALALQKIDELIAAIKALTAKLDADTGVSATDYSDLSEALKETSEDLV